jgi:hypothetical protein
MGHEIIPPRPKTALVTASEIVVPTAIAAAGEHAARRFLEFFEKGLQRAGDVERNLGRYTATYKE